MPILELKNRPCERQCPGCKQWLHHSRFAKRNRGTPNDIIWEFDRLCRACQQIQRHQKKNEDRALAVIKARAQSATHKSGETREFFWVHMGYWTLVEDFRTRQMHKTPCRTCGHPFDGDQDIQIDHILPPRHCQDWARLHATNLQFLCGNCNKTKGAKLFGEWLDEQETARIANLEEQEQARLANLEAPSNRENIPQQRSFDFLAD